MNSHKMVKSLSYFSIFFAPILVPLFIWVFGEAKDIRHHAKIALISHLAPTIALFFAFSIFSLAHISTDSADTLGFIAFAGIISFIIFSIVLFFFNIIRGVQMLVQDDEDYYAAEYK
ncbi:hypothetical protein MFLO_00355 [Listeria floridensis FSL S10-1187]|uniref:DUF4870 domain-containing protein n=1 Tax=Listeria floridensis FSL S10-1187 TaxID=1265817 RepID=A0ABP3B3K3_9LIST|nr:DUF4870 domain-containing protein [Listeria floridensis]EUJ33657.1 hypothetical protein MFLO_00355 [Listeria floridensis FSL S10-1187]